MSTPTLREVLGGNLRARRRALGLRQHQVADIAGLDQSYLSLLERGDRSATVDTVELLAIALDTTPAALLEEERPEQDGLEQLVAELLGALPARREIPALLEALRGGASVSHWHGELIVTCRVGSRAWPLSAMRPGEPVIAALATIGRRLLAEAAQASELLVAAEAALAHDAGERAAQLTTRAEASGLRSRLTEAGETDE